jgi:acetyl esterase/lipase
MTPQPRTEGSLLSWRDVIVAEPEGFRPLTLDLFRPADAATGAPLVIWIHGGAWRFGTNKHELPANAGERILAAGYALATITYRLSGEATFPAQLHDVKAAVRWLRHCSAELGLDPARFAVWGESAGGHLASMLALTAGHEAFGGVDDEVQAGIVWYGPSNLLTMAEQNHPQGIQDHNAPESPESRLIGGPVQLLPTESAAASPVSYVAASAPPLLLVHGDDDRVVPEGQSRELHERLTEVGADVELEIVPGADHGFAGGDVDQLVGDGLDFLRRKLPG